MNDIKLDQTSNTMAHFTQPKPLIKGQQNSVSLTETDDIKVNLQAFNGLALASDNSAKVAEMKQRIESGNYKIDTDALAAKLYHLSLIR